MSFRIPKNQTTRTVYVSPGEIAISTANDILRSTPLGSCVAVILYDKIMKTGGMAHVMLPGKAETVPTDNQFKFAVDAIDRLLHLLLQAGAKRNNLEACLVGGANVLKRPDDTIARAVTNSVLETIRAVNLTVKASSLGGTERRTALLMTGEGTVYYTLGNSPRKRLWTCCEELLPADFPFVKKS